MTATLTDTPSTAPAAPSRPKPYAHVVPADFDVEAFGVELDAVRRDITADLGPADEEYIRTLIADQQRLERIGRTLIAFGIFPPFWLAGVAALGLAKILENMEIGHNIMHGQWDWLSDPDLDGATYDWDTVAPGDQWRHSHNEVHHTWTNVLGMDRDIGYGTLRMAPEQQWRPRHLANPFAFVALASLFQWGVGVHDLEMLEEHSVSQAEHDAKVRQVKAKIRKQVTKDYVRYPLLAGPFAPIVFAGNVAANFIRNVWAFAIIFCGHFPDGTAIFTPDDIVDETRAEFSLRQILGSANIAGGPLMHLLSGNLSHQIEHHLFPDLPSNRYAEAAERVRAICDRHGVPYNERGFWAQFGSVVRKALRLTLP
jgi:fatty acid desaturase